MAKITMDDHEARRTGATVPCDPPQRSPFTPEPIQPSADADNDAAFSEFYREFVPILVAFLVWQGAGLADATDIAQDTMIKAYQRWSEIDHPKAWARTVASRALVRRIASIVEEPIDQLTERSSLWPTSINVAAWEQRYEVLSALDRLSPRQRQVTAWTLDGYTPTEIATELQITAEAVRANLMKARRALATHLGTCPSRRVRCRPEPFPRCRSRTGQHRARHT